MSVNINNPKQLGALADELRVRYDWHEPDEQGVNARVSGTHLDNAMGADPYRNVGELTVIIEQYNDETGHVDHVAFINLANLLAWASMGHRNAR